MITTPPTMTHDNNTTFNTLNEHIIGNVNTVPHHIQQAKNFLNTIDLSIKEPTIAPKIDDFNFFPTIYSSTIIYLFYFIFNLFFNRLFLDSYYTEKQTNNSEPQTNNYVTQNNNSLDFERRNQRMSQFSGKNIDYRQQPYFDSSNQFHLQQSQPMNLQINTIKQKTQIKKNTTALSRVPSLPFTTTFTVDFKYQQQQQTIIPPQTLLHTISLEEIQRKNQQIQKEMQQALLSQQQQQIKQIPIIHNEHRSDDISTTQSSLGKQHSAPAPHQRSAAAPHNFTNIYFYILFICCDATA